LRAVQNLADALMLRYKEAYDLCARVFIAGVNRVLLLAGGAAHATLAAAMGAINRNDPAPGILAEFNANQADALTALYRLMLNITNIVTSLASELTKLDLATVPQNPVIRDLLAEIVGQRDIAQPPDYAAATGFAPTLITRAITAILAGLPVPTRGGGGGIGASVALTAIVSHVLGLVSPQRFRRPPPLEGSYAWYGLRAESIRRLSAEHGTRGDHGDWMMSDLPKYLTYVSQMAPAPNQPPVESIQLTPADAVYLEQAGQARFNTRFIRNLVFITSTLRLVRLKLNREVTHSRKVVVENHLSIAPGVTEFGVDPFSPNEKYDSTLPGGYSRFEDAEELGNI